MPRPKIFLDGTSLHVGGGVQVGAAVFEAVVADGRFDTLAAASPALDARLSETTKAEFGRYVRTDFTSSRRKLSALPRLRDLERSFGPDLVYTVFGPAYWRARRPHVEGFARVLSLYPESHAEAGVGFIRAAVARLKNRVLLHRSRTADYIVVESDTVKRKFSHLAGYPEERIFVVPNTHNALFEDVATLDATPSGGGRRFVFFTPAAAYPHKNLERQVRAAAALVKSTDTPFELVFTLPEAGSAWRALVVLAKAEGISDRVRTVGLLDRPALIKAYRDSRAVLFPSLCECSSSVFPEAFISRRPVIAADRPYARELCGRAAIYVDPLDSGAIAAGMAMAMDAEFTGLLVQEGDLQLHRQYCSARERAAAHIAVLADLVAREARA